MFNILYVPHSMCKVNSNNLTKHEKLHTLILKYFTVFIILKCISVLLCTLAYICIMSIQNHTGGTLQHLVMKTNATPFMILTMGWNLMWLTSRWRDSRSDNAATCHRIRMSATQWAQLESRRCASSYRRFKHTRRNWRWRGRGDARSSWCIENNYRVQLASSIHRTSTNTSNSGEIIGLKFITLQGNYIKCNSSYMQSSETNTIPKLHEHTTNTITKEIHDAPVGT